MLCFKILHIIPPYGNLFEHRHSPAETVEKAKEKPIKRILPRQKDAALLDFRSGWLVAAFWDGKHVFFSPGVDSENSRVLSDGGVLKIMLTS